MKFSSCLFGGLIIASLFSFSGLSAQEQAPFPHPNGVKRTWTFVNGTTAEATLSIRKNQPPTWERARYELVSEDGKKISLQPFSHSGSYTHRGVDVSFEDITWIRDAIFIARNESKANQPLDPALFADPDFELPRNNLEPLPAPAFVQVGGFPAAFGRFALWWDLQGYLPISKADEIPEKSEDILRSIERHYTRREKEEYRFQPTMESIKGFFEREYEVPVIFSSRQESYCTPARLAHYCKGRNATILKLHSYESGRRQFYWLLALLSADTAGNVELEIHGDVIKGRVKPIDPEDGWKEDIADGAQEIEILNRDELTTTAIHADIRLVINPQWDQGGLWVMRPWILTDEEHLSTPPPVLMPPSAAGQSAGGNMLDKVLSAVTAGDFDIRKEWTRPELDYRSALEPAARTWTKTDGKSANGVYLSSTGPAGIPVAIDLKVGTSKVTIPMDELSPLDQAYVYFIEEARAKTVRLTYELRESKTKATLIQLECKPGLATATYKLLDSGPAASRSLLDKARSLISDGNIQFVTNFNRLSHSGDPGTIDREDFTTPKNAAAGNTFRPFTDGALSQHLTLPCRNIVFGPQSEHIQQPGYQYSAKFATLDVPEAAHFWSYFAEHSEFKTQLEPCAPLFETMRKMGGIPLDVVCKNKIDPDRVIRLHLVDVAIVEP